MPSNRSTAARCGASRGSMGVIAEERVVRINRKSALVMAAAVTAASLVGPQSARAAAFVWDGTDSATNTNWSNGLNWAGDPVAGPLLAADTVAFDVGGLGN